MEEQKNNMNQEEKNENSTEQESPKDVGQHEASTVGARKIIYGVVILLALIIVPWTIYAQLLFRKGNSLCLEGKYAEAAKILRKSRRISLSFQVKRDALSDVYLDIVRGIMNKPRPDYALCEELCKEVISFSKDPSDAHLQLSDVYYEQTKYEKSLEQMNEYLKLNPGNARMKKLRDARKYFVSHTKASKMLDVGIELQKQGKLDEAIASYEEVFKKYPQFEFVRKQTAKAYLEKRAALPDEALKSEGESLIDKALALLDKIKVHDDLEPLFGRMEEVKKKGTHYKLAAIYVHMRDYDNAINECNEYKSENPNDKVDNLLETLQKVKREEEAAQRGMAGAGGGAGAMGQAGRAGAGGNFRERFKHTIELVQLVRKLPKLEDNAEVAISPQQALKITPILKGIEGAEKVSQKDAEAKVIAIKAILSEAQLAAIEKIKLPRRRGGGAPTAMMPGMPGGPGAASGRARNPDANPFKSGQRKEALTTLIELLEKKTTKEK